jgi:hypothetical protein
MLTARALPAALGLLLALPAAGVAAPTPDRVLDEVSAPFDVGVDGAVVAYTRRVGTRGVQVVIRDGSRPAVRLSAGRGASAVDVGRDERGRRVVVYTRCGARCDLVAFSPAAGRSRVVARGVPASDVAVGRGRAFWIDGRRVRSRALTGGPVRAEGLARGLAPAELDTDGITLAVTGELPTGFGNGTTGLSVTRVGSGRARLRAERTYGEEYAALRSPVVTAQGVSTLFDYFTEGVSYAFADAPAGGRGFRERTTGGMGVLQWDAGGGSAAFVEAPTNVGCEVGDAFSENVVARAPCRIVLAAAQGERLLPPRVALARSSATVLRATLAGSRVVGRRGLAGVAVELRRKGRVVARLVTDAGGRVALPPRPEDARPDDALAVVALTEPPSYAYYGP